MARIEELYKEIDQRRQDELPQLSSPSATAEYKGWQHIYAVTQASAEDIIESDKADIQTIVDNNHVGTPPWYVQIAKQFQFNENETYYLIVDPETGAVRYNRIVPEDRIIKQASYVEGDRSVIIKVATTDSNNTLQPLTPLQIVNFENYMREIKMAGIKVSVVNLPADLLELTANVYYNPAYNNNNLQNAILQSLDQYSLELQYDGIIYKNAVIDAIQRVEGVVDIYIPQGGLVGIQGEIRTEIERSYTTNSGYFNIKKTDGFPKITLIAA